MVLATVAFTTPAKAATTTVACGGLNDIGPVQMAVNAASNGDTIVLSGICNFVLSLPHGGDQTSIESAAVVVRPGAPINGLTITGDGGLLSMVIGNALNTAFFIAPGNNNVTIKRLQLVNFARPIVTQSNNGTIIGDVSTGVTPSTLGNRIIGGPLLDSSILALANDRGFADSPGTVSVSYGRLGQNTASWPATGLLTNLTVAGNYITYGPVGIPTPTTDVIAIDVRQKNGGNGRDIEIDHNAVGFLSVVFLNFNINGIRVHAHSGDPGYHMTGVSIHDNNLGRLEELPEPLADINASGRAGIVVVRATNVSVANNKVKVFETPIPLIKMPGGAIILSDVTDGVVIGNNAKVFGDLLNVTADLGGIGIVDDINSLFGSPTGAPDSANIQVLNNTIGSFPIEGLPLLGAMRGIVVNGTTQAYVRGNNILSSTQAALNIGVLVEGPGPIDNPGTVSLPRTVTFSDFCSNILDGVLDDPTEVDFGGGPASIGNSFPGGASFTGNGGCGAPSLIISESSGDTRVTEGSLIPDTYTVRLSRIPQPCGVSVTVAPDAQVTALPAVLNFTPLNWNIPQTVTVLAVDDAIVEGTHFGLITHTAASCDPLFNGLVATVKAIVFDNDFGLFNVNPLVVFVTEGGPCDQYSVNLNSMPDANVTVTATGDAQVFISGPTSRTFTSVNFAVPQSFTVCAVDDTIREGTPHFGLVTNTATSTSPSWDGAPVASVLAVITDNDKPLAPVFLTPGDHVCSNSVLFTGTGEVGALVEIFENNALIGSAVVAADGTWSIGPINMPDGPHVVAARQTGTDGLISTMTLRVFTVITTAPSTPVILVPVDGSTVDGNNVEISGTADPLSGVAILISGVPVAQTIADTFGNWSVTLFLQAGPYTITAIATNGCFFSAESPPTSFTVVVPDRPTIITPSEGQTTPANVLVSGTAPDGTTVRVVENGKVLASGIPVSSGQWSVNLVFKGGPHTIVAYAQTANAISLPSDPRNFFVDATPPTIAIRPSNPYVPIIQLKVYVPLLEALIIEGTASDNLAVDHIELTYTPVLPLPISTDATTPAASCPGCPGPHVSWSDSPDLGPGLYEVSGIAVDTVGNVSDPAVLLFLFVI